MKHVEEPRNPAEMESLGLDGTRLLVAQRNYDLSIANIISHHEVLAEAALILGDHTTALTAAAVVGKTVQVQSVIDAINTPDDDRCSCEDSVEVQTANRTTETRQAPTYLRGMRVWSDRHQAVVQVYSCHICGHTQAIAGDIDQFHASVSAAQAHNRATVDGGRPNSQLKPDHSVLPTP